MCYIDGKWWVESKNAAGFVYKFKDTQANRAKHLKDIGITSKKNLSVGAFYWKKQI